MRKNIFKLAFLVAVVLSLDKIIFWQFSLIQIHDTFDGCLPIASVFARNILKYGFVAQVPQNLCGTAGLTFGGSPGFILTALVLSPYANYLFHSIAVILVAFSGMFLLLNDEFRLDEKASLIGALFFVSVPAFLPWGITIAGIPLLFWAFERVFDVSYGFKLRSAAYLYILIYFFVNCFFIISLALLLFYLTYFLLFSNIRKNVNNLVILCLIWTLYLLFNLPVLTELVRCASDSHRNSWILVSNPSWISAAKNFAREGINTILISSMTGLMIIGYYLISSERSNRDKIFYFPVLWVIFIMLFSFFIYKSPFWWAVREHLGIFKSVHFDRFYLLSVIFFSIMIGQASDFIIRKKDFSNKIAWIVSAVLVSGSVYMGLKGPHVSKMQFLPGLISLLVFLFLAGLRNARKGSVSFFLILLIPFLVLVSGRTAYSRVQYGVHNYYHFFNSGQIEKVKAIEKGDINGFRVVKIGGGSSQLLNNGFKCADGYSTLYPMAYKEFWSEVIRPELEISEKNRSYFLDWGSRAYLFDSVNKGKTIDRLNFNLDLLKLINVKYVFSDRKIRNFTKYGLIEIAEKPSDYFKTSRWKRYFKKGEFYVYQNEDYAQPVFLTDLIRIFEAKEKLLGELGKRDYNYLKKHTFVLRKDLHDMSFNNLNKAGSEIFDYRLTPDMVEIELANRYSVILNWTRNYDKNWVCMVDGKESKILNVYNSFMGVVVPPGTHLVKFTYRDIRLKYACLIAAAGFFVVSMFVLMFLGRQRNKQ